MTSPDLPYKRVYKANSPKFAEFQAPKFMWSCQFKPFDQRPSSCRYLSKIPILPSLQNFQEQVRTDVKKLGLGFRV